MDAMKLTLARPVHAEHIAKFYRSIHGDEFTHPEMFDEDTIAQLLRDEELAVVVAANGRKIVGAGLGFVQTWNQVLEIGALSVDEVPDRTEIGKALFEALRRYGMRQSGVAFFRARSEAAFRRGRDIGAECWGFRPLPGSRDIEEAEIIMGFFEGDGGMTPRIRPPKNAITKSTFAARILAGTEGQKTDVPYPKAYPVGAPRGTGTPVISGRIWPTYHKAGNYMTIESSAGPFPIEIIKEFVGKVRQKGVSDIRLALPVNHDQAFVDLIDFGFTPVAYLPGWHLKGTHRFDCVEMQAGAPRIPRYPEGFIAKVAAKVNSGLLG